jgi:hypothetical protein
LRKLRHGAYREGKGRANRLNMISFKLCSRHDDRLTIRIIIMISESNRYERVINLYQFAEVWFSRSVGRVRRDP